MSVRVGQRYRVYFESPEGMVWEAGVVAVEISRKLENGQAVSEIRLVCISELTWIEGREFVHEKQIALEWKCIYCDAVNPREATYCGEKHEKAYGCGAHRSFVYSNI